MSYLITISERIVSNLIGLELSVDEVKAIIASDGNPELVSKIKLSKVYDGYITILSEEKK